MSRLCSVLVIMENYDFDLHILDQILVTNNETSVFELEYTLHCICARKLYDKGDNKL